MLARFSGSVTDSGGRTVEVQPATQMVCRIVAWVTAGFSVPGVHCGSGREYSPDPSAWQEPGGGWDWTTCAEAVEYSRPEGLRPPPPGRAAGFAGGGAGDVQIVLVGLLVAAGLPVAGSADGVAVLVALVAAPQPASATAHATTASGGRCLGIAARRTVIG